MRCLIAACALVVTSGAATADQFRPALQDFYETSIASWANDPALVAAIIAQNTETGALSQADIDAMDQAWRSEVDASDRPTITAVLNNDAAAFLRAQVAESEGVITEVFAMDARGLNVAASDVTSDFWQGDEDKHSMTYGVGPGAVHLGNVEFDESTSSYQGQISVTIVDPASGEAIGALTVGVNAQALM